MLIESVGNRDQVEYIESRMVRNLAGDLEIEMFPSDNPHAGHIVVTLRRAELLKIRRLMQPM